ncbi:GNAT family N-acetyltransferase [Paenibacillus shirakamiensis]|nr:GNAT family protein [Paenibacillus shirakamiensis]
MSLQGKQLKLRRITTADLPVLYKFMYADSNVEWKKWDAPYFPLEWESWEAYADRMIPYLEDDLKAHSRLVIEVKGEVIGQVVYYWEHEPSLWMETGIVIYDPAYWSGGYGTEALRLWMGWLFNQHPIARIGITTWSGNVRMMRTAEKIGLQVEGRMRKCRIVNGEHFDSIRMGILREEWEEMYGV